MDALNTLGTPRPLWDEFASLVSSRVDPLLTNTPLATVVIYPPPRQFSQKTTATTKNNLLMQF